MWRRITALVAVVTLVGAACGGTAADEETATTTTEATTDTDAGQTDGQSTLDVVKARGKLICGTNDTLPGFGFREPDGSLSGLDVDFCRAIAAAVLADANAVDFIPLTAAARFTALQTGEIDVLIGNTTWIQSHDVTLGADFAPTTFFDGQGIMAKASDGFDETSTVADLEGAVVCTIAGTTTELNMSEAARVAGVNIDLQTSEDFDQVMAAFQAGSCDVVTTDKSDLISRKATAAPADFRDDLVIFGVTLSKEPLGPMYRANDSTWGDVVDWTVFATWIAEEKGITSGNIDSILGSTDDGEALRLFGRSDDQLQTAMGLNADAFYQVVLQLGNYGEIYDRNLGPDTVFNVPRGLNQLWTNGGLMYPPPAR